MQPWYVYYYIAHYTVHTYVCAYTYLLSVCTYIRYVHYRCYFDHVDRWCWCIELIMLIDGAAYFDHVDRWCWRIELIMLIDGAGVLNWYYCICLFPLIPSVLQDTLWERIVLLWLTRTRMGTHLFIWLQSLGKQTRQTFSLKPEQKLMRGRYVCTYIPSVRNNRQHSDIFWPFWHFVWPKKSGSDIWLSATKCSFDTHTHTQWCYQVICIYALKYV